MITETIKTEIWEDVPDKPGYTRHVSQVPLVNVFTQVHDLLKEKGLLSKMDYFNANYSENKKNFLGPYGFQHIRLLVIMKGIMYMLMLLTYVIRKQMST